MASIVIYDSGVGGLSIYQEVLSQCPDHRYVFVSDNQAFPYGTKAEDELVLRVLSVTEKIAQQYQPDILVVACNTASTVVLPLLRERFEFSIVGVVPAIKPAAQLSSSKVIGLLATPATVERGYTMELVAEFASDCSLVSVGSSELVQIAEDKLYGKVVDTTKIAAILEPILRSKQLDTLVLACTHFPLLRDELEQVIAAASMRVVLVDSGAAIARRVERLVPGVASDDTQRTAAFTETLDNPNMLNSLDRLGFSAIEYLAI